MVHARPMGVAVFMGSGEAAAGQDGGSVFNHPGDVVRALRRYSEFYDPRSTSLMVLSGGRDADVEPFRAGFITRFDERRELARRMARLPEKERKLLTLWHCAGHPVAHVARKLGISRVHCYRLAGKALDRMLDDKSNKASESHKSS